MEGADEHLLVVDGLAKAFPPKRGKERAVRAVENVSFTVPEGTLFTLLGPSGCGKTTTLRCIAGLENPDSGNIKLDGRVLFSDHKGIRVPPNRRHIGMVFQSYAIWPHMTVLDNVSFPLVARPRSLRLSRRETAERVERALTTVKLEALADRPATDLSGGQQQRLAFARAIVMEPALLLMDEPLSSLDAKLRAEMRLEVKRLQSELGATCVYVTHDQTEALAVSDVIAVMDSGSIVQRGSPFDIYNHPSNAFVADFIGVTNFIDGVVKHSLDGLRCVVETEAGRVVAAVDRKLSQETRVVLCLRPERIRIERPTEAREGTNMWRAEVISSSFLGDLVELVVAAKGVELRVRDSAPSDLSPGQHVSLTFPPEACRLLDAPGGP